MAKGLNSGVATVIGASAVAGTAGGAVLGSPSAGVAISGVLAAVLAFALLLAWHMTLRHGAKTGRYPRFENVLRFEQVGADSAGGQQLSLFRTKGERRTA
jgi:hypothetical protein